MSQFLSPYKVVLPSHVSHAPPTEEFAISAVNDTIDEVAGTRSFTLKVYHPGVIWTGGSHLLISNMFFYLMRYSLLSVIAFDAHVLKWTLDDSPPDHSARHHIKEASFYGQDTWTVDLTVKLQSPPSRIKVDYIGIGEKRMWPGKMAEKADGGRAMALFEELDQYIEESTGGTIDVMLLGCLGGEAVV